MIYNYQLNGLSEEEFAYLAFCLLKEWEKTSNIKFNIKYINFFKEQAVIHIVDKYKNTLKDEYLLLPEKILDKMFLTN